MTEEQWSAWDERYQEAAGQLQGRDEALAALGNEIETDLELVGVTAIEDKLQDGVPQAIQSLLSAGLKVRLYLPDLSPQPNFSLCHIFLPELLSPPSTLVEGAVLLAKDKHDW